MKKSTENEDGKNVVEKRSKYKHERVAYTIFMKTFLLASIASLLFPVSAWKNGTLPDVTKPYLGEYECKTATLRDMDLTEQFDCAILELQENGSFCLRVKDKTGKMRTQSGKYVYDRENELVTFTVGKEYERNYRFPMQKGNIYITIPFGKATMRLEFEQK